MPIICTLYIVYILITITLIVVSLIENLNTFYAKDVDETAKVEVKKIDFVNPTEEWKP